MNEYYVYVYCDPRFRCDNDYLGVRIDFLPIYIGYGCRDRMLWHLKLKSYDRNLLKINKLRAIFSGGNEPIIFKVLDKLGKKEAQEMEKKWIAEIGTISEVPGVKRGPLTNLTAGGDGGVTWIGRKMTDEHKEKIRKANTGVLFTEERKRNLSKAQRRRVIVISDEKRKKMIDGIRRRTRENLLKSADGWRGAIWINKNGKNKRIKPENLSIFLQDGWAKGFLRGGQNKMDQCKCCGKKEDFPNGKLPLYEEYYDPI